MQHHIALCIKTTTTFVLVSHLVDGRYEMVNFLVTVVNVPVVFGQKVDVVEDEAVEVVALQRFDDPDVEQTTSVEFAACILTSDRFNHFNRFDMIEGILIISYSYQLSINHSSFI